VSNQIGVKRLFSFATNRKHPKWWNVDQGFGHFALRNPAQQVANQRQSAASVMITVHQPPWRKFGVCRNQHRVAGATIISVLSACLQIGRTEIPAHERISATFDGALFLQRLIDHQPVFFQGSAVVHQQLFERGDLSQDGGRFHATRSITPIGNSALSWNLPHAAGR